MWNILQGGSSLGVKINFSLIRQVVSELGYVFCQER